MRTTITLLLIVATLLSIMPQPVQAAIINPPLVDPVIHAANSPVLSLSQSVSEEPLLGGSVGYSISLTNNGQTPIEDKGYNLTITDTLSSGVTFVSANPAPTFVSTQDDGSTIVLWDNIADIEVDEDLTLSLVASLDPSLTTADTIVNNVEGAVNTAPDNSGSWVSASDQLSAQPQAIDIEMTSLQSTADDQATGAGEYDSSADWPYQYRISIKNNNAGTSNDVEVTTILPSGAAYLGGVTIDPNPNGSVITPTLELDTDGSLQLHWNLGDLTTARYADPVIITFETAIPYKYRTSADTSAESGSYAGPMSGGIIPEDAQISVDYEVLASYGGYPTTDGTQSTPDDDSPARVTAEYLTVSKSASPGVVGIGTTVDFTLNYYVSEYYTTTNVILTDLLPDGMTYVDDSASLSPTQVQQDTPSDGQTTITWELAADSTTPGNSGTITFQAIVDSTYEAAPYTDEPVVSGDSLTNQVTISDDWQDTVTSGRNGTTTPDTSYATVTTRMPSLSKDVWVNGAWSDYAEAFTGDTMTFRVSYASASDVDAKSIIIRDFLPRGMTFVSSSDTYSTSGSYSNGSGCTSAPTSPTVGALNGLQYLEWKLCNADQNSTWQVELEAILGDIPNVQPGWLVANFGKLSGQNTSGEAYSLRDIANIDYIAPELVLGKNANPFIDLEANDTVTYTIAITNTGEAAAYNLVMTDTIPSGLKVSNSGGSASPTASSYTTISGNPSAGTGGVVRWSSVSSLAVDAIQAFTYTAVISDGLPAGYQMDNIASVAYNSRSDNNGHQWGATSDSEDSNTDDMSVYVRGVSIIKSALPTYVTIGEVVTWTITGTVPDGVVAYWPVLEENNLPAGFDYISGTTTLSNASLDTANHGENPKDSGNIDLRWYLDTIDNSGGGSDYTFVVEFETLVTGVKGTSTETEYYLNHRYLLNADNDAYIGWYDTSGGYNGQGYAYDDGFSTKNIDHRSPQADFDVKIRQPYLTIYKAVDHNQVGAGDVLTFTLQTSNMGNNQAFETTLVDTLPPGLTLVSTEGITVTYPDGFPQLPVVITDSNSTGDTNLTYEVDVLYVGATWHITYTAQVATSVSGGLSLLNTATISSYSSLAGARPDSNSDGLPDERFYSGPTANVNISTPEGELQKSMFAPSELTFGSDLVYTLTIPSTPINATLYDVVVSDTLDSRLQITGVTNGSNTGNQVNASFGSILPNQQEIIVIDATLPAGGTAENGDVISNQAVYSYTNGGTQTSNEVAVTVVAPALVLDKQVSQPVVEAGDTITYTLSIANVGGGVATNFQVTDTLPANMSYVGGSALLNGSPLADPSGGRWDLADLDGGATCNITFRALVNSAAAGTAYINTVVATAQDSLGQPIPADNSSRVPADTDPDDQSAVRVYGPLTWETDSTFVAYEDLKDTGWCDWDYNDFVVRVQVTKGLASSNLAVLEIDYEALARGAGFDHQFIHELPIEEGGRYYLTVSDAGGATLQQNSSTFSTESSFTILDRTLEALPPDTGLYFTNTPISQTTYITGYSASLIVVLDDPGANPDSLLPPLPWDPYLYVYNTDKQVHLVIPGHLDNTQLVNGVYDPTTSMLGYDLPLAQTFEPGWAWPIEYVGIWRGYPNYVDYMDSGGAAHQDWVDLSNADEQWLWCHAPWQSNVLQLEPLDDAPTSRYFSGPVVADLDDDGSLEIIMSNAVANRVEVYTSRGLPFSGWPQSTGGSVKASVSTADLDGDGNLEIVAGAGDGYLYAWHHNGQAVTGWPVQVGSYRILAAPAVADLDNNGSNPEIVVPLADGRLYAFNADGSARWNSSIGEVADSFGSQVTNSSPSIADLDNNGSAPEVIVGSYDKNVYAFNADGSQRWSFATGDIVMSSPVAADIHPGHSGLEVAIGSGDGYLYLLDQGGGQIWRRNTGWIVRSSPTLADVNGGGDLEIMLSNDYRRLVVWDYNGSILTGWPQALGDTDAPSPLGIYSSPAFGDIDGDGDGEVVIGSDDAHIYAWQANGSAIGDWPQATASSVRGTPVLANLDSDDELEVIVGDFGGNIYTVGGYLRLYLPLLVRNP